MKKKHPVNCCICGKPVGHTKWPSAKISHMACAMEEAKQTTGIYYKQCCVVRNHQIKESKNETQRT